MLADINELINFLAVAKHRSFRKAAEERNLTPSTLSHSMRTLEDRLGVKLLNRTTRSVVLTEAGGLLFGKVEPILRHLSQTLDEVHAFTASVKGTLRLNVPRPGGRVLIEPIINGFLAQYPDVQIEMVSDDSIIDIVDKGFDAGLRFGGSVALDMIAIPIGPPQRFAVVASPAFIEAHGRPASPEALRQFPCIGRRFPSGVLYGWEFQHRDAFMTVRVQGPLTLDDDELMIRSAISGVGLAYVHRTYATEHLESGALVSVLEEWCNPIPGYYLYYPRHRHNSAVLRVFIEWCNQYYQHLAPWRPELAPEPLSALPPA